MSPLGSCTSVCDKSLKSIFQFPAVFSIELNINCLGDNIIAIDIFLFNKVLECMDMFGLEFRNFGCSVNTLNSAAGVPQGCTVAFTAYKPGSKVAYQTINERFNPTGDTVSKLAKATFPKTWQKMGKIEISVVESTATTDLTALDIDSVSYTLYKCD